MKEMKKVIIDIDGSEVVSRVILDLVNSFPGLGGRKVKFSSLDEDSGFGFFPSAGSVLVSENENIVGHVTQVCSYPFTLVYRVAPKSEAQRLRIKGLLDALGRWLEKQPVTVDGETVTLTKYPDLPQGQRVILSINRNSPGTLNAVYPNGVEDWTITVSVRYENQFDK